MDQESKQNAENRPNPDPKDGTSSDPKEGAKSPGTKLLTKPRRRATHQEPQVEGYQTPSESLMTSQWPEDVQDVSDSRSYEQPWGRSSMDEEDTKNDEEDTKKDLEEVQGVSDSHHFELLCNGSPMSGESVRPETAQTELLGIPNPLRDSTKPRSGSTHQPRSSDKSIATGNSRKCPQRTKHHQQLLSGKTSQSSVSTDSNILLRGAQPVLTGETEPNGVSLPSNVPVCNPGLASSAGSNQVFYRIRVKTQTPEYTRRASGSFKQPRNASLATVEKHAPRLNSTSNSPRMTPVHSPPTPRRDGDMSVELEPEQPAPQQQHHQQYPRHRSRSHIGPQQQHIVIPLTFPPAPTSTSLILCSDPSMDNSSGITDQMRGSMSARTLSLGTLDNELPILQEGTNETDCISVDVVADLVKGVYNHKFNKIIIIDCRFEYEYKGGHIHGAINISTGEELARLMFRRPSPGEQVCIVFHCEFSSHRGPNLWKLLRNWDRNNSEYPNVIFRNMYVMHKGYEKFYESYPSLCSPRGYVRMKDKTYTEEMKRSLSMLPGRRSSSMSNLRQSDSYDVASPGGCNLSSSSSLSPVSTMGHGHLCSSSPIRIEMDGDLSYRREISDHDVPIPPRRFESYDQMVSRSISRANLDDDEDEDKKDEDDEDKKDEDDDEDKMDIE